MKYLKIILSLLILTACAVAPMIVDEKQEAVKPKASAQDFRILEGAPWEGELDYLNYGRTDRSSIPVGLIVTVVNETNIDYAIRYPGEEEHNSKESFTLSADGRTINGDEVISRTDAEDKTILVTLGAGEDNNQPADIKLTYTLSASDFRITKDVRFHDEEAFFNRHVYRFSR